MERAAAGKPGPARDGPACLAGDTGLLPAGMTEAASRPFSPRSEPTEPASAGPDDAAARDIDGRLRAILADVLALDPARVARFDGATALFGALPELDSMAVAELLTAIEDRLDIVIEDDEVDGEMLGTYGALRSFVIAKSG